MNSNSVTASVEIERIYGHPALFNNEECFKKVHSLLKAADQQCVVMEPSLGGEDFAHYLNALPGTEHCLVVE